MIGIIDYNAGNIRSVERALEALKIPYCVSKKPADLSGSDRVIFPGVGEARYAMEQLKKSGFDSFLKDFAASGKPLLGICLGSQIIFDYSEEGDTPCLGLVSGKICHFSALFAKLAKDGKNRIEPLKIPHMGWNNLERTDFGKSSVCKSLFAEIAQTPDVYFVHSYLIQPQDESIVAAFCNYGVKVPAIIKSANISAFQFHPEKSGEDGLRLLRNFALGEPSMPVGDRLC